MTTLPSSSTVLVGGSRALRSTFAPLVCSFVRALLRSGGRLAVGCACGADDFALGAGIAEDPQSVSLFAIGDQNGFFFWDGSAPFALLRLAFRSGAHVSWLAGGDHKIPLQARLIRRSTAAIHASNQAVFFLADRRSAGSLAVARRAASDGRPVFVVCCGFDKPPPPLRGRSGSWSPASLAGIPASILVFEWVSTATQPNLF